MQDEVRRMIREILQQEIAALGGKSGAFADTTPKPRIRKEQISIRNNSDLMQFVRRILELAKDGRAVQEIKSGKWIFHLQNSEALHSSLPEPACHDDSVSEHSPAVVQFESGLISERQIAGIQAGSLVKLGKKVRITPLAQDEIRRRQIHVERAKL